MDHECLRATGLRTGSAQGTGVSGDQVNVSLKRVNPVGTGQDAIPTADAFLAEKGQLTYGGFSFRVVAPGAAQRASLEENGTPNSRSVVHGKVLDIKNKTGD